MNQNQSWSIEDAIHLYQVERWSDGYFTINNQGHVCSNVDGNKIDINTITQQALEKGIKFPFVIRFQDILRSRVKKINQSFNQIMSDANYQASYFGVYPIKVNQLREVVEEITDAASDYTYGLEAGSKAELLTVLAYNNNKEALTILNGYKDLEYMQLACLGSLVGKNIIVVIEKLDEIHKLIQASKQYDIMPNIGVRVRLNTQSSGKWNCSSGDKAKFGLSISEVFELIDTLTENDLLEYLNLFHFHAGSQIPDIRSIKDCLTEAARIYCELKKMGAPLRFFDVGGGVGLNYDGSKSNTNSSTNYDLDDYIADVVYIMKDICDDTGVSHPNIVSETGRALAAYHSCVITNVFGQINNLKAHQIDIETSDKDHLITKKMKEFHQDLNLSNYQEVFNDASIAKDEAIQAFKLGVFSLQERSFVEKLFWNICSKIVAMTKDQKYIPNEIRKLQCEHARQYLCNFSVFQSTPDSWAIEQILPIVPISRNDEVPNVKATLADITCDSDGAIKKFLSPNGHTNCIDLHELNANEDYPIGIFLTGAYQDTMGDMHNLFGRLNEVHVYQDDEEENGFYIEETIKGQSCADVLKIMQYSPKSMCDMMKSSIDKSIKAKNIKAKTGAKLHDFYEKMMYQYTYLSSETSSDS